MNLIFFFFFQALPIIFLSSSNYIFFPQSTTSITPYKMATEEIHSLYDTILILDFGSQVRIQNLNHLLTADNATVLPFDHSTMPRAQREYRYF